MNESPNSDVQPTARPKNPYSFCGLTQLRADPDAAKTENPNHLLANVLEATKGINFPVLVVMSYQDQPMNPSDKPSTLKGVEMIACPRSDNKYCGTRIFDVQRGCWGEWLAAMNVEGQSPANCEECIEHAKDRLINESLTPSATESLT